MIVRHEDKRKIMALIKCETCGGEGQTMHMACYGGPPVEIIDNCPDCDGEGEWDDGEATPAQQVTKLPMKIRDW